MNQIEGRILETRNYEIFALNILNRDTYEGTKKWRQLLESMKEKGFIPCKHMNVLPMENGKHTIVEGHNRLRCAKTLGIPVYYVIQTSFSEPNDLPDDPRWSYKDHLIAYCRKNYWDYLQVKEYVEKTGMPITSAVSLLAGELTTSNNHRESFKRGDYQTTDIGREMGEIIAKIINGLSAIDKRVARNNNFINALSRMVWLSEFKPEVFIEKAKTFPFGFTLQADLKSFMKMIEDLYNRQSRNKVPLCILADNAAKERGILPKKT